MTKAAFLAVCLVAPGIAAAQDFDSMMKAQDLGSVLASETFCGLSYDQDAIGAWIDQNTDPADMGFAASLETMTMGAAYSLKDMSPSGKTAHCRSIARTAQHYGFIQ